MKRIISLIILWSCFMPAEFAAGAAAEPSPASVPAEASSSGTKKSPAKEVDKKTAKNTTPAQQAGKGKDPGTKPPVKSGGTTSASPASPSPANGAVLENGFVAFTWPRSAGIPSYELQVSSYRNFTTMVVNVNTDAASLVTSTELGPGTYYWRVRSADASGQNRRSSPIWSFKVSATAPVNTMTDRFINRGMVSTNSTTLSLALSATGGSGIVAYAVWEHTAAAYAGESAWVPVKPSTSYAAVIPFAVSSGDGSKTVSVRFKDKAGKVTAAKSGVITLDTSPPDTTITGHSEDLEESTSASFSFTSTESGASFHCSLDDGLFEVCASPRSYSGLLAGKHTIAVRAIDGAGNIDPSPALYSWVARLPLRNTTPPGFINKSAPVTDRNIVRLSLSAFTAQKEGVSGYYVSEFPDAPAITDPGWIKFPAVPAYARDVEYTLSEGNGKKTVYVWFKDAAGNVSDVQIDTITRFDAAYVLLIFLVLQAMVFVL